MRHVVFAPHVDDEVIGCWTLLNAFAPVTVAYCSPLVGPRLDEARNAAEALRFSISQRRDAPLRAWAARVVREHDICWAPDPHFETHPFHKEVGALIRDFCARFRVRFGTYTTSMNTPYLVELSTPHKDAKRKALDTLYPSQRTLWQHDWRYFLFEGRSEWNPPA